ncbi:YIP1 family protein [Cognatishimia activa]|uniref:YIP1 family protein n=1 Tax=Cognatishimia activa TaxID=1715691 RepID=A0A975I777_9RHOB|nr:YIP1 family protein [Cognatishimia activa]QTN35679.1 YIP1 family protein [Cognatishimia activa]
MSVTRDILATYRGPGQVVSRRLAMGVREDRGLAILMAACVTIFIAQWPRLAREAHLQGLELNMLLGGQLLVWIFIMPLAFYVLAIVVQTVLRIFGRKVDGFTSRFALFWALLAIAPISLFRGLVGGFIGPGVVYDSVGLIAILMFTWFWMSGLRSNMATSS